RPETALDSVRSSGGIQVVRNFDETIDQQVGWKFRQPVAAQAIADATGPSAGVARRLDVNFGIANKHRLFCRRAKIAEQDLHSRGIRLLRLKAVAAIDESKIFL